MDTPSTHLIAFAAPGGPQCQRALAGLQLPHLEKILQRLEPAALLHADTDALTPLHESLVARQTGLRFSDGLLPWAAEEAQALGLTALHGLTGWARITPCHWTVHADHVHMDDPAQLSLTAHDQDALWQSMEPYFSEDGITLFAQSHESKGRYWLAHGAVFRELPTASLDRVAGQKVDPWMPRQAQAKTLRRLQNEMQMLLYHHPVNDERARYHLPSVNSFWVSATGTPDHGGTAPPPAAISLHTELRAAALKDDGHAWALAWHALDQTLLAATLQRLDAGEPVHLILTGEQHAVAVRQRPASLWARLQRRFSGTHALALLKTL
ncbi:MAG: phosphoglycerate mutase [Burkholderiales bacterium PBB3]|nr:MAG: phosphoglycerate mutase [Burkholderiales bacterium PBB3]